MAGARVCIFAIVVALTPPLAPTALAATDDGAVPGHEVFELRVEDGGLVLRTTLPPTPPEETRTVALAGVGGSAELVIVGPAGGGGVGGVAAGVAAGDAAGEPRRAVVPDLFKLEAGSDDTPGRRVGTLVSWHDGVLDVQQNVHHTGPNRYTRLTRLIAARQPEFGTRPSVQLMVTEHGDIGRPAVEVNLREVDFVTLRRRHEAATDLYLRPILRELGQEAVFAPDPLVARQVFPERWQPDPVAARAVERLLPALDGEATADREAASARIAELGEPAALVLMRLDRAGLTAEQNARIDVLLRRHAPLRSAEARRRRRHVPFLLDCLNSDDPLTRAAGLEHLWEAAGEPVEFDPALPVPARGAAVAALRERLKPPATQRHAE
jgi:hypothetical protein